MFDMASLAVPVDAAQVEKIPYTLKEWTAVQGPRTLVAALTEGEEQGEDAFAPRGSATTLKAWTRHLGPKAHAARLQLTGAC